MREIEWQDPCPDCEFEPGGCPKPSEGLPGAGPCDGYGHDCPCEGITQGLFTVIACESCYVAQK